MTANSSLHSTNAVSLSVTRGSLRLIVGTVAAAAALGLGAPRSALATPIGLGSAAAYAVISAGGTTLGFRSEFEIYQSGTVINGNVAEGPFNDLTHNIDATINGNWDYDLTNQNPCTEAGGGCTGAVAGGFHQMSLIQVVLDARTASNTAAALAFTPGYHFSTLAEDQVINVGPGLTVVRVDNDVTLKKTLTINGPPGSSVVFQLLGGGLTLSGVNVILGGGIAADDIIWNLAGYKSEADSKIQITSSAVVFGNILAPDRWLLVDNATVNGRVIAGGSANCPPGCNPPVAGSSANSLSIHSSSTINAPLATTTTPEPASIALIGTGLIGLAFVRRRTRA